MRPPIHEYISEIRDALDDLERDQPANNEKPSLSFHASKFMLREAVNGLIRRTVPPPQA